MTEKLNNNNIDNWEKNQIKKNRIKYFNIVGIDLGEDYENYLNLTYISPSEDTIKGVLEKQKIFQSNFNRDYYNGMLPQRNIVQEMQDRGFLDFDPNESAEMYMCNLGLGMTYVTPNIVKIGDTFKLVAKVVINFGNFQENIDHSIDHELNHLYELALVGIEGSTFTATSGWDIIYGTIASAESAENISLNRPKRPYELFNEIINEKISKEISQIRIEKGIQVLGKPTQASLKNATSYDATNYLVDDFFKTYKKEILASRKGNNLHIILDAVGKENFDALNQLFSTHKEHFSKAFVYADLLKNLAESKDTEETRVFHQLEQQRDEILEKMHEHYLMYKNSKGTDLLRPTEDDLKAQITPERIAEAVRRISIKDLTNEQQQEFYK